MVLTIQLEHILHVKDTVSSHPFQPVLPTAAREIFQENLTMISLALILSRSLCLSLHVITPEHISHHSPHCSLWLQLHWPSFRSSNQIYPPSAVLFISRPFEFSLPSVDIYSLNLVPNFFLSKIFSVLRPKLEPL